LVLLLDVNVLVALAWPNHVHHETALAWFQASQHFGWATCPITQSGFVRVSSNERVLVNAKSPREAMEYLRHITALPHHRFWIDDVSLVETPYVAKERLVGHRQVTDAHLLALALRQGGRLATFDRSIRQLVPAGRKPEEAVLVLERPSASPAI
jgi:toxin-antitoxin system PIN domain toxin